MDGIFIVEDDGNIRELLVYALCSGGFAAEGFEDAAALYKRMERGLPGLFILDIMLSGEDDGYTILKKLKKRSDSRGIPVIMLTAKAAEYDKVRGLDMGADDYITKPFGVMELISRVKAVLRRSGTVNEETESPLRYREIKLDPNRRTVEIGEETVELTYKEFELLYFLMMNSGIVLSRVAILESIWGYEYHGETRTVDVHIRTLRQKLGKYADYIKTIRNVGYKIGE